MKDKTRSTAGRDEGEGEGEAEDRPTQEDLVALGDEIAQLAGQIAAAEARFLRLLGEFDAAGGWGGPGIRSLAHWLSWRAGMSLRTAQEHIRMARALRTLPVTSRTFEAGELSFSKVRALTRVASPATEDSLVRMAKNAPAAHVERIVAGLRKVPPPKPRLTDPQAGEPESEKHEQDGQDGQDEPQKAPAQRLRWRWDEETDELVVWGRFGAADGKAILAALTRAELERIRTQDQDVPEGGAGRAPGAEGSTNDAQEHHEADPGGSSDAVDRTAPPPCDAGPALVALAQIGLAAEHAPVHAAAAEVIYLHVSDDDRAATNGGPRRTGRVSADEGPLLDRDTGEEVLCGAAARCVVKGAQGSVLAYGRRRRLFSAAQLKALRLRDGCCQTPGCGRTRFLHAHHVVYWWHGGLTDLDNAVLLCSACHRSVHLGRLRITALGGQQFEFVDASSGAVMDPAPSVAGQADRILAQRTIGPRTVTGGWFGEPLDLSAVTAELIAYWRQQDPFLATHSTADTWGAGSDDWGDEVAWDDPRRGTWEVVPDGGTHPPSDEAA